MITAKHLILYTFFIFLVITLLGAFDIVPSSLQGTAYAQKSKKASREKHIIRKGRTTGNDRTKIDFDETDITGQRRTPLGDYIGQSTSDRKYDFIKIRKEWHEKIYGSAKSLDYGKN